MSLLKRLISDTAIYGTSSILARGLHFLLTFLIIKIVAPAEYGIFTQLYAMVAFLMVILTHGMETSFFRHVNLYGKEKNIFSTAFSSVGILAITFLILTLLFLSPIAGVLNYANQEIYIAIFAFIVFFDVLCAVPFANLRHEGKAKQFAGIKIFNIVLTILLNLFFLVGCPALIRGDSSLGHWIESWYLVEQKVIYVFIANLAASAITLLLHAPQLLKLTFKIDRVVYKRMLLYALPIMLLGFAGTINEMMDRLILRDYLPYSDEENLVLLAVYGFAYKLAMIMSLFLQAYKYAVEPILFSEAQTEKAPSTYALIMKYYVIAVCVLFVLMVFNLPLLKHFLFNVIHYDENYRAAFKLVPILLGANAFLGIYFNIATWYKVSDKTMYGAYIAIFGAIITITLNLIFVPIFEIEASAWATLICYVSMAAVGLWFGQKFYPIPYKFTRLLFYIGLALVGFGLFEIVNHFSNSIALFTALSLLISGGFVLLVRKLEFGR